MIQLNATTYRPVPAGMREDDIVKCQKCGVEHTNYMGGFTHDEKGNPVIIRYCLFCGALIDSAK